MNVSTHNDSEQCDRCGSVIHADCWEACDNECLYCVTNAAAKDPIKTGATLLIVPRALVAQTLEEFEKHVRPGTLRCHHYIGVHQVLKMNHDDMLDNLYQCDPRKLGKNDVIVMALEDLRIEEQRMRSTKERQSADTRTRARLKIQLLSPLDCIDFQRIVIDEADASIPPTTKLVINSIIKQYVWCVTGTPTGDNIINGILNMCDLIPGTDSVIRGVKPLQKKFNASVRKGTAMTSEQMLAAATKIVKLFGGAIWRVTHEMMAAELNIPPQHLKARQVYASSYEAHLYTKATRRVERAITSRETTEKAMLVHTARVLQWKAANSRVLYEEGLHKNSMIKKQKVCTLEYLLINT
jgi:SNF2-related domain